MSSTEAEPTICRHCSTGGCAPSKAVPPMWRVNLTFGFALLSYGLAIVLLIAGLWAGQRDDFARGAFNLILSAISYHLAESDRAKLNRWSDASHA